MLLSMSSACLKFPTERIRNQEDSLGPPLCPRIANRLRNRRDLVRVIEAWLKLLEAIRKAMLALAESGQKWTGCTGRPVHPFLSIADGAYLSYGSPARPMARLTNDPTQQPSQAERTAISR